MENKGPISENDLMHKLVIAKKIMNKVDSGNFERNTNNYDTPVIEEDYDVQYDQTEHLSPNVINEEKIASSKLPQAIKDLMLNNPIVQPSVNVNKTSMFDGARKLMEREGLTNKPKKHLNESHSVQTDYKKMSKMIEEIVRRVFDEKLNELKEINQLNINENLAIKVGDSIFSGKITKVRSK